MSRYITVNGNEAAARAAYAFTEASAIYPITPSTPMAELADEWSAQGRKNLFGDQVRVVEMQSEAGAAGAVHGLAAVGVLTSTFTASQGLLLMIPNMYKIAGELLPCVFHVSARAIAAHALSIFGDHQDVMACRQTGFALLASSNVQEVMDFACISHLASIKARIPFLHFFDGFRTSHEYQKIEPLQYEDMKGLLDLEALRDFRRRGLNPERPFTKGSAQNPDIYFQGREAANPFYERVPAIVQDYLNRLAQLTNRSYGLFDYHGHPRGEEVVVAMGSVCDTIEKTVDYLLEQGEKVGLIKVRLYRPFSGKHFLAVLPDSVEKIAVLDRTKEPGSPGEPLYLDVIKSCQSLTRRPLIVGGRYGLGSKDTRPAHIRSVFRNLQEDDPRDGFTIGIVDDLTYHSLPAGEALDIMEEGTISCKFWGLGSDGTVGANQGAVRIIGENTDLYAQAYFSYDSKKSGGTTVSHLRFGPRPIKAPYLVEEADYIACHNQAFVNSYDLLKGLKPGGTFVLNCTWGLDQLEDHLPISLRRNLGEKAARFYIIDAVSIAEKLGLGNRINMIMQAAFFQLAKVIPIDDALRYLKQSVQELYGRKGRRIVEMNEAAIDQGVSALVEVEVPPEWKNLREPASQEQDELPPFVENIQLPMARLEGDNLPVSAFKGREDGVFPNGTTAYEKRGIAVLVPQWQLEKCIQCNQCSFVCPHAVIRPFLLDEEELSAAPEGFLTKKALGKELQGLNYRIQVSALDCTGCGNCADVCPAAGKALIMKPAEEEIKAQGENWEFALTVASKAEAINWRTLKGSQFKTPLFEFHGACPGCGETPYLRLISQLFGERMLIANATGCSSIYSASAPSFPYTVNEEGLGPAWANSLFEDNAEYGLGMLVGINQRRQRLKALVQNLLESSEQEELKEFCRQWLAQSGDPQISQQAGREIVRILSAGSKSEDVLRTEILNLKDHFTKKSLWVVGGDGWAYDIGFGGLDHVLSLEEDLNILVLDTEVYSNTGGQSSKATPTAAVAKFAAAGKRFRKKDLGRMAMVYGSVYVAQIALGANMNHCIRTILEAESYPGPSLLIAYSPCINHGIRTGMGTSILQEKRAVEAGYWHLYRYNPLLKKEGKNPFSLDSKEPSASFSQFLKSEFRYSSLENSFPELAQELFAQAEIHAQERYEEYKRLAKE
ncbi:MAG: pyruvate:ferredoxin (flavodoxin) oxidoreductase [Firmicutes bacterium]|nr:pyruvate:ferredoxin (flavodoxin) oxidoreductase [Bacillota bacterium]